MEEHLGDHVEVIQLTPYPRYMDLLQEGQFSIESFPFGGCNTVVDALWLKQPIVCLEGDRWFSKIGTALVLQAGIDRDRKRLLASNAQQYEDYITNLINDPELLQAAREEVLKADLQATLFDTSESQYFVQAISKLLEQS